jgi:hypothetical protein
MFKLPEIPWQLPATIISLLCAFLIGILFFGYKISLPGAGDLAIYKEKVVNQSSALIATSICYSGFTTTSEHSLIVIPLNGGSRDLDAQCKAEINPGWKAGGIAKSHATNLDCGAQIVTSNDGSVYTSYVTEKTYEKGKLAGQFQNCNNSNAFVCCSPQFPD